MAPSAEHVTATQVLNNNNNNHDKQEKQHNRNRSRAVVFRWAIRQTILPIKLLGQYENTEHQKVKAETRNTLIVYSSSRSM
ncbi:hypothetical protein M8J77_009152 [Diaphorina citri]|nr:hypothetical protein M8J77_009152 [Diaphorina citri]